jgi:type IV secretion system protein VirB5
VKKHMFAVVFLSLGALMGTTRPAHAQFAVIDVGAIAQLVQEVQQLQQQIQLAQSQLAQAQQAYAAITGGRGMELLLNDVLRNYLPATWDQLLAVANGGGGARYGALGADVAATIRRNIILRDTEHFSQIELDLLKARRSSVALNEALARQELQNVSARFEGIQSLINAIPRAKDEKAILDLQARITAEQGMLQNENSKLHVMQEAARSQAETVQARADELAIQDIGHLAELPPLVL